MGWATPTWLWNTASTRTAPDLSVSRYATRPRRDVGEREGIQVAAHMNSYLGPNGEEDALALVVARAVLVGFAEVTSLNGPVDSAHDLAERDLLRWSGENVPAANPPLGPDDTGAFQRQQDLLQVGLRKAGPFRDVSNRGRVRLPVVESQ